MILVTVATKPRNNCLKLKPLKRLKNSSLKTVLTCVYQDCATNRPKNSSKK